MIARLISENARKPGSEVLHIATFCGQAGLNILLE